MMTTVLYKKLLLMILTNVVQKLGIVITVVKKGY